MKTFAHRSAQGLILFVGLLLIGLTGCQQKLVYQDPQTRKMVALVDRAAAQIAKQGPAVFSEMNKIDGPWVQGDLYLFGYDAQERRLVYPFDLTKLGEDCSQLKDVKGRWVVPAFFAELKRPDRDYAWVHYYWPKLDDKKNVYLKSSYVKKTKGPDGRDYVIGSGIYDMPMEKPILRDLVDDAAALVQAKGAEAFPALRDKKGKFFFGDIYVFVNSPDGIELVNPAFPRLENTDLWDLQSSSGDHPIQRYINLALKKGSGWITYRWPKPGASTESTKYAYVRRVTADGQTYIVGSGYYAGK